MIPSSDNPHGHRFFEGGGFPDSYGGAALKTDFRVWLRYRAMARREDLGEKYKALAAVRLCYAAIPEGTEPGTLMDGISWFDRCGEDDRIGLLRLPKSVLDDLRRENERRSKEPATMDYFWDYREIWASFRAQFNIDLYREDLHWWAFQGLMGALDSASPLGRLIGVRTIDYRRDPSMSEVLNKKLSDIPERY